ncbi:MAG: ATP-binding protein [Pseudomonadota bacterium]
MQTRKYVTVPCDDLDLGKRNRELAVLLELSNLLAWSASSKDLLYNALSYVLKHLELDAGRLYLMDDGGQFLRLAASLGVNTTGLKKVSVHEGFTGRAVSTRQFIAQHVAELPDKARVRLLSKKGFVVVICVPLIVLDQVVGVLNLAARRAIRLEAQAIDLLIVMGNLIAVAVNNARLNDELRDQARQLEEQKSAVQYFAVTASHDLKSPAVGIYALTQRLMKLSGQALGVKGEECCRQILKAATRIEALAREISAFMAVRGAPLKLEQVRLTEVLETVRAEQATRLAEMDVAWEAPADLPTLRADRLGLIRAFQNLLDNALKYGGRGLTRLRVIYREEEHEHVLGLADDGVGLDPAGAENLFKAFQRGATSQGTEGTGLGLAIVREVAERHGGRAWLESAPGQGATFYLSLAKGLETD